MDCGYCEHSKPDCGAPNPGDARRLNCTRAEGHGGRHMACGLRHPSESWSSEDFADPAPAPIDPVLVTLAAAALPAVIAAAERDADGRIAAVASDAVRYALATRAALREAGEGGTK